MTYIYLNAITKLHSSVIYYEDIMKYCGPIEVKAYRLRMMRHLALINKIKKRMALKFSTK